MLHLDFKVDEFVECMIVVILRELRDTVLSGDTSVLLHVLLKRL